MDSALSGWFAGLLAAVVSIAASAWWDSRLRRREMLDAAMRDLAAPASMVGLLIVRGEGVAAAERLTELQTLVFRARALANRRVGFLRARWAAPTRRGLAMALHELMTRLAEGVEAGLNAKDDPAAWTQSKSDVAAACELLARTTERWFEDPWSFWRFGLTGRDPAWGFGGHVQPAPDRSPRLG